MIDSGDHGYWDGAGAAPPYKTRVYFEVISWRPGFTPGKLLEVDHGDLERELFSANQPACSYAKQLASEGKYVRVQRVERRDFQGHSPE